MKIHLNLIFGTTEGKSYTIRVPNAADSVSPAPIKNSMTRIIDANAVQTNRGDLLTRERAQIVRVTSESFDVK